MSRAPEIRIMEDETELAREAAELFLWLAEEAMHAKGWFSVALSGGTTPQFLHRVLGSSHYAPRLDWTKVRFFFGDERCVPPDHSESNFGMANVTLFQPLKISSAQISRMKGEEPPDQAAHEYEGQLRQALQTPAPSLPRLDLALMGIGEDGHTASLFPGTPALQERTRLVVPGTAPQGIRQRLTMTLPILNQAQVVLFLVTATNKSAVVRKVLEKPAAGGPLLPAALVRPEQGRLIWFLDRAAAADLTISRQEQTTSEE